MRETRNAEVGTRNGRPTFCFAFRVPRSGVEHRRLFRAVRRREPEMPVRGARRAAAAWRAGQEPLLHQERLVHFLERAGVLPHGGGDGRESHRTSLELLAARLEAAPLHVAETDLVYVQPLERLTRHLRLELARAA